MRNSCNNTKFQNSAILCSKFTNKAGLTDAELIDTGLTNIVFENNFIMETDFTNSIITDSIFFKNFFYKNSFCNTTLVNVDILKNFIFSLKCPNSKWKNIRINTSFLIDVDFSTSTLEELIIQDPPATIEENLDKALLRYIDTIEKGKYDWCKNKKIFHLGSINFERARLIKCQFKGKGPLSDSEGFFVPYYLCKERSSWFVNKVVAPFNYYFGDLGDSDKTGVTRNFICAPRCTFYVNFKLAQLETVYLNYLEITGGKEEWDIGSIRNGAILNDVCLWYVSHDHLETKEIGDKLRAQGAMVNGKIAPEHVDMYASSATQAGFADIVKQDAIRAAVSAAVSHCNIQ